MTTATHQTYGAKDAGCWFDCARGIYIGDAVIETAIEHGWLCAVPGEQASPYQISPTWTDHEHYHELWDEAEQHMQQFADDKHYFGGNEHGDWGLWPVEEEEHSACGRCGEEHAFCVCTGDAVGALVRWAMG